jgi:hypothetical protein
MLTPNDENQPISLATLPNGIMPRSSPPLTDEILQWFRDAAARARNNGNPILDLDRAAAERQAREMGNIVRQFRGPPPEEPVRKSESPDEANRPSSAGRAAYLTDEISRQFRGGAPHVKDNGEPVLGASDLFAAERNAHEMAEIVRRFRGPPPQAFGGSFDDRFRADRQAIEEARPKSVVDYLPAALSDIPTEIRNAQSENLDVIRKGLLPGNRGEVGEFERLLDTGRGLAAILGLAYAPITGAARSLIGHPMADLVQFIGESTTPEGYPRPTNKQIYEDSKRGADLMLKARRPAGLSLKVGPR